MPPLDRTHEVIRDATLTFAHVLKTHLPPRLEGKPQIEVFFDSPTEKQIEKAQKEGKIGYSVVLIDMQRSPGQQTQENPIIRAEDDEGNIAEFKLAPPTAVRARYLFTPWTGDALYDQIAIGLTLQLFFSRSIFMPDDIQGHAIRAEPAPMIEFEEKFGLERQIQLWAAMGKPFKASLVYAVSVRMDSMTKTLVRRVKERILDYKKVEG